MHNGGLKVRCEQRGHTLHLHVGGELDISTAPVLEGWLAGAETNGNTAIVVDLENVTFMDVSGLRAFLRAAERASRNERRFVLVNAPHKIRRVLHITRTTFLLEAEQLETTRELAEVQPSLMTEQAGMTLQ